MGYRKRKRKRNGKAEIDDGTMLLDCYFNRKFCYSLSKIEIEKCDTKDISQQLVSSPLRVVNELQEIKADLNSAKNLLSSFDIIKWRNHTQFRHRGDAVLRHIKRFIKPELCTKAWCKFYEILSHFSPLIHFGSVFNSYHLCEAPGAFIASLNHFLHTNDYQGRWTWGASTLNPLYEGNDFGCMIDADEFINETLDHWCFGADNTGNVMSLENVEYIQKVCAETFKEGVDLVTCDGSFDCANEPEDQEKKVFALQYCEAVASLSILKKEGMMVLKMFTMFEGPAVSLMYLLSTLFKDLYVFKPVTSKPGNSEVYVIALQFQGIAQNLLQELKDNIKTGRFKQNLEVFPLSVLPDSFLREHLECCRMFSNWQKETILENVQSFLNHQDCEDVFQARRDFCRKFLSLYKVRKIEIELQIVPNQSTQQHMPEGKDKEKYDGKGHVGSLVERKQILSQSVLERLSKMEKFNLDDSKSCLTFQHQTFSYMNGNWKIICGKMFDQIGSTKFCNRVLLKQFQECLKSELLPQTNKNLRDIGCNLFTNLLLKLVKDFNIKSVSSTDDSILCKLDSLRRSYEVEITDHKSSAQNHLRIESFIPVDGLDVACIIPEQNWITRFIDILLTVKEGCSLLLPLGALLTRISAHMFLLLLNTFQQVSVFRDGQLPYVYVYAHMSMGISKNVQDKLREVGAYVLNATEAPSGHGVLSFLPSNMCSDLTTVATLHEVNDDYLKMRINYFLALL